MLNNDIQNTQDYQNMVARQVNPQAMTPQYTARQPIPHQQIPFNAPGQPSNPPMPSTTNRIVPALPQAAMGAMRGAAVGGSARGIGGALKKAALGAAGGGVGGAAKAVVKGANKVSQTINPELQKAIMNIFQGGLALGHHLGSNPATPRNSNQGGGY